MRNSTLLKTIQPPACSAAMLMWLKLLGANEPFFYYVFSVLTGTVYRFLVSAWPKLQSVAWAARTATLSARAEKRYLELNKSLNEEICLARGAEGAFQK